MVESPGDKECIPKDIRDNVESRENKEARSPWYEPGVRPRLAYISLTEYLKIITQKGNWERIFQVIFKDKERIVLKLKELEPIRNKIAHAGEVSEDELVQLKVLPEDILGAIRK